MIRLLDKTKISFFTYFYVFCFIAIYAGHASVFAHELGDIRTVGNAFALALTAVFVLAKRIPLITREYGIVVGVFLLYALTTAVVYRVMSTWWISTHILLITYAYVISKAVGTRLLVVFETIIYHQIGRASCRERV